LIALQAESSKNNSVKSVNSENSFLRRPHDEILIAGRLTKES